MRRSVLGATVSLVLGSVLAGCGGGSNDRLTKDEFVKQADAICAKFDKRIETAAGSAFANPGKPTDDEIAAFATSTIFPTIDEQLDDLRALEPPKADEAQVDAIFDEAQASLDELRANPALLTEDKGFEETDRLARAYGLTACAN
jgi:hypothetical protein